MSEERARELRRSPTEAETRLWNQLRRRQVARARFRRQVPLGPYIVDFMCPSHRLIVEVDGGQHAERVVYDAARTEWLQSRGFTVLRFWNNDVLGAIEGVVGEIERWLLAHPPPS
jgi:very-short-patch-repair endonuclease